MRNARSLCFAIALGTLQACATPSAGPRHGDRVAELDAIESEARGLVAYAAQAGTPRAADTVFHVLAESDRHPLIVEVPALRERLPASELHGGMRIVLVDETDARFAPRDVAITIGDVLLPQKDLRGTPTGATVPLLEGPLGAGTHAVSIAVWYDGVAGHATKGYSWNLRDSLAVTAPVRGQTEVIVRISLQPIRDARDALQLTLEVTPAPEWTLEENLSGQRR